MNNGGAKRQSHLNRSGDTLSFGDAQVLGTDADCDESSRRQLLFGFARHDVAAQIQFNVRPEAVASDQPAEEYVGAADERVDEQGGRVVIDFDWRTELLEASSIEHGSGAVASETVGKIFAEAA